MRKRQTMERNDLTSKDTDASGSSPSQRVLSDPLAKVRTEKMGCASSTHQKVQGPGSDDEEHGRSYGLKIHWKTTEELLGKCQITDFSRGQQVYISSLWSERLIFLTKMTELSRKIKTRTNNLITATCRWSSSENPKINNLLKRGPV